MTARIPLMSREDAPLLAHALFEAGAAETLLGLVEGRPPGDDTALNIRRA